MGYKVNKELEQISQKEGRLLLTRICGKRPHFIDPASNNRRNYKFKFHEDNYDKAVAMLEFCTANEELKKLKAEYALTWAYTRYANVWKLTVKI